MEARQEAQPVHAHTKTRTHEGEWALRAEAFSEERSECQRTATTPREARSGEADTCGVRLSGRQGYGMTRAGAVLRPAKSEGRELWESFPDAGFRSISRSASDSVAGEMRAAPDQCCGNFGNPPAQRHCFGAMGLPGLMSRFGTMTPAARRDLPPGHRPVRARLVVRQGAGTFRVRRRGRVVAGEDVLEDPGGGAPATAGFGGGENDLQVGVAEFFPGLEKSEGELGVLAFPAAQAGGAEPGFGRGGAVGEPAFADQREKDSDCVRVVGSGPSGARGRGGRMQWTQWTGLNRPGWREGERSERVRWWFSYGKTLAPVFAQNRHLAGFSRV